MINNINEVYVETDNTGCMIFPKEVLSRYNIKPGSRIKLIENKNGLQMQLPSRLAKLYIEPTNKCNLDCRTCMRNVWKEPMGMMSKEVFSRIMEGLRDFSPKPSIFFGGLGEPLFHPDIIDMVIQAKSLGTSVELITNGTLLTRETSQKLVEAGLDILWVSIDGSTPESYADIRLGAALPKVLENLGKFQEAVYSAGTVDSCPPFPVYETQLGIVFVAMKRNIADLPAVINIGKQFGARHFLVTNILPYTREMVREALYFKSLDNNGDAQISIPGMDADEITCNPIYQTIRNLSASWSAINSESTRNRCPFIESGAGAISWEGNLSPCLPLLHSHTSYVGELEHGERVSRSWAVGNITKSSLIDIWSAPEHLAFRERVKSFGFSPCTTCHGCDMSERNEEDCYGNEFPTCGACLWAQGVIVCP